jgi:hypothetical protein
MYPSVTSATRWAFTMTLILSIPLNHATECRRIDPDY